MNYEWRMANGEWRMANGEWRMANGEWRMANGEWRMANGEWRMANGESFHPPHPVRYPDPIFGWDILPILPIYVPLWHPIHHAYLCPQDTMRHIMTGRHTMTPLLIASIHLSLCLTPSPYSAGISCLSCLSMFFCGIPSIMPIYVPKTQAPYNDGAPYNDAPTYCFHPPLPVPYPIPIFGRDILPILSIYVLLWHPIHHAYLCSQDTGAIQ
jgi:hypothetical protein